MSPDIPPYPDFFILSLIDLYHGKKIEICF